MSHARAPIRRQVHGETRLVMEYLAQTYPDRRWSVNVKLGIDPETRTGIPLSESERRLLQLYKRFADAIVFPPPDLIVIEATIEKPLNKIGPLLQYLLLVPHTPELKEFAGVPVRGLLLTAIHDIAAERVAKEHNLQYMVFAPPWLEELFATYPQRRRRSPAPGTFEL